MGTSQHFNRIKFSSKLGEDIESMSGVLTFTTNMIKQKMNERKHFKQRIQIYRFAHFLRGTTNNICFEVCSDICNDLLTLTDSLKNENEQAITQEMIDKLDELEKSIYISCNIVDAYISSKSG